MEEQIKIFEELAKAKHKARLHFLEEKSKSALKDELVKAQAAPIVAPIVEAITKTKPSPEKVPLSKEDIRRVFTELENIPFDTLKRNRYIQAVSGIYQDDNLFNTFLTLNKNGVYRVPIAKMLKYGVVESLIFYGQGGKNLDMLPANMQMKNFKARLADFDEFYNMNSATIQQMLGHDEDPQDVRVEQQEGSDERYEQQEGDTDEEQEGDDTVYDDAQNESFGEGLAERLSILHASKNAGNTSLDLVNEAQDILKLLLKRGKINKAKYLQLERMFD